MSQLLLNDSPFSHIYRVDVSHFVLEGPFAMTFSAVLATTNEWHNNAPLVRQLHV